MNQAVEDFEHGLDSILTDSVSTPELDEFLDENDAIPSSVSSGSLHLISTVSDTTRPQLAPSIEFQKLWCQARALLLPVQQAGKNVTSKFTSLPFWS